MRAASARRRFRRAGIAIAAAVLVLYAPAGVRDVQAATPSEVDLLLVLAVDMSDSINGEEAKLQRYGIAQAITDPAVIAAIGKGVRGSIAVTYLEWASPDEQNQVTGWMRIADAASARVFADKLTLAPIGHGYWTSISAAIDSAAALILRAPFAARRRVIDISSDGRNNRGAPVFPARRRALALGITINGLVVIARRSNFDWPPMPGVDKYFRGCVIGGPGAFVEVAEGFPDFVRAVRRKLIREIAGPPAGVTPLIRVAAGAAKGAETVSCE